MELIDTHAHLVEIEPICDAIQKAVSLGVKQIVAVGMDLTSNRKTLALARRFPGVVLPAIGYHPWSIRENEIEPTLAQVNQYLGQCVALGEVGLDYKVKIKKPVQIGVFKRVLDLAAKQNKPVIVHARFSHERTHRMVAEAGIAKAVFHWYSGPLDVLDRLLADGYHISATPALAYSPPHQAAIKRTPLDRILLETDSPVTYQGKISEPADLLTTLHQVSDLKKIPVKEVATVTNENAHGFFDLGKA